MKRRDFLKTPGYFVAAAAIGGATACDSGNGDDGGDIDAPPAPTFAFPQGVASGDPRDTSVVLWTRVEADDGSQDPITVIARVSDTPDMTSLVLEQELTVDSASDHTLRLLVTGLTAATEYYYQFQTGDQVSTTGRTLTAPLATDPNPVRLAWVACQDYATGTYSAYRELIKDDDMRPADQRIQFILHLGDFIYETVGQGFQGAIDEQFQPIEIMDQNGMPRRVDPLPSGGGQTGNASFAVTVDDYRHLYKQFLRDPDLQAARARWPFIYTWDDHEFTNDSWQTQANYDSADSLDEPSQTRKVACNQAWFEYAPSNLSDAVGVPDVPNEASDFSPTNVSDVPYSEVDANNMITEQNNLDALASITIYRSFRYGQNVELVITDNRSYRSDHPIPEELTGSIVFFDPRNAVPVELADTYDEGMTANGGNPPDTVLGSFPNPRANSPVGTMLGATQKAWWKNTMQGSDATWKVWGNSVPLFRLIARNNPPGVLLADRVASSDAWDGYNTERVELMSFLRDQNIGNAIVLSGDLHAHFASTIVDDYKAATPQPVAVEFTTAGISSNSMFSFYESATRNLDAALRQLVTYDGTAFGDTEAFVNNLNVMFKLGTTAALQAAQTHDLDAIVAAADPEVNPFLAFADTNAQGYGIMTVTSDEVTATLVTINRPLVDTGTAGIGIKGQVTFTVARDDASSLSAPGFSGDIPFPYA